MRKGAQDLLRSDRGLYLRGIDCDPGIGRRTRVTPRRWRANVICRAHYGYRIRVQCYLRAQDNASCNHSSSIVGGGWHRGPHGRSAISQRHMILRGYFAMREHVDGRAGPPPGSSTGRSVRTRLHMPRQRDVILPRLTRRIAQVVFGSTRLECYTCAHATASEVSKARGWKLLLQEVCEHVCDS